MARTAPLFVADCYDHIQPLCVILSIACLPMVVSFCSATSLGKYQLSVDILTSLSKVPRFGMIAMFMGQTEKSGLPSCLCYSCHVTFCCY